MECAFPTAIFLFEIVTDYYNTFRKIFTITCTFVFEKSEAQGRGRLITVQRQETSRTLEDLCR